MPDSTPETVKPAVKTTPTKRASPGLVNKEFSEGLDKAEKIVLAAQNPLYVAQLTTGGIAPAFVTALAASTDQARAFLAQAVSGRGNRKSATLAESAQRTDLSRKLQTAQTRALQKFHDTDPDRPRDTYYVGTSLSDASDALLLQISTAIIEALSSDALPGITPQFQSDLAASLTAWRASIATQSDQGSSAIQSLAQFEIVFKQIEEQRRTVQFAADADFPFYDPLSKKAREAFDLPTKTPFR